MARISPRFNSVTEDALDYNETNSFISLTFFEGKIDFINAAQISKFSPSRKNFWAMMFLLKTLLRLFLKRCFLGVNMLCLGMFLIWLLCTIVIGERIYWKLFLVLLMRLVLLKGLFYVA